VSFAAILAVAMAHQFVTMQIWCSLKIMVHSQNYLTLRKKTDILPVSMFMNITSFYVYNPS
jgi:hypothetical protein